MKKAIHLVAQFAKPYRRSFAVVMITVLISSVSGLLYPFLLGKLMDEVFYNKDMGAFWTIVLAYAGVYLFNQVILIISDLSRAKLEGEYLFDVRHRMFQVVLAARGKALTSMHTGDIVSRMGQDTTQLLELITWSLSYGLNCFISGLVALGFLFFYNVKIGFIAVGMVAVSLLFSRYFSKRIKARQREVLKKNGLIASWLFEMVKGLTDISLLSAGNYMLRQFVHKTNEASREKVRADQTILLAERADDGLWLVGKLLVYVVSAILVSNGEMMIGAFVAIAGFAGYFEKCVWMFHGLSRKISEAMKQLASVDRVQEIMDEPAEQYEEKSGLREIEEGTLRFHEVYFSYTEERPVLEGITFEIKAGSKIALVGKSGAGKTTIANLLLRIYRPERGEILVDGFPLEAYRLCTLREQIGIVHQDTVLFDGTVRYNVALAREDVSDEAIWGALEKARLSEVVRELPQGLDTVLGTQGRQLSGGQKQRLAIARIFLKNPKVLIFDEATSALDSESEAAITESVSKLSEDRTVLIIAHRLSTILSADSIMVLDGGRIVDMAPHDVLMERCESYRTLFYEQYCRREGVSNEE